MLADEFVMGETGLSVLADHVNVLEVTLYRIAFEDRCNAASIINGIDDAHCESNRMSRGETE